MTESYASDDDGYVYDDLDEVQESWMGRSARWSWTQFAATQLSNVGNVLDTFGKVVHDTSVMLHWHANYRHAEQVERATQQQFAGEALAEIEELTGG